MTPAAISINSIERLGEEEKEEAFQEKLGNSVVKATLGSGLSLLFRGFTSEERSFNQAKNVLLGDWIQLRISFTLPLVVLRGRQFLLDFRLWAN